MLLLRDMQKKKFEQDTEDLGSLVAMYPEIPITAPVDFPFTLKFNWSEVIEDIADISPASSTTFFVNTYNLFKEYVYTTVTNKVTLLRGRPDLLAEDQFFGKIVKVYPKNHPDSYEHEDEKTIVLAPCPVEINSTDYVENIYRDHRGVVKSSYNLSSFDDEGSLYLIHFGKTPWKVREIENGNFTNVIFENLYDGEIRRYIIEGTTGYYFMLRGKIFASVDDEIGDRTNIVRCSTGEIVQRITSTNHCVSLEKYAVILDKIQDCVIIVRVMPNDSLGE